jgi:hypothetical protein
VQAPRRAEPDARPLPRFNPLQHAVAGVPDGGLGQERERREAEQRHPGSACRARAVPPGDQNEEREQSAGNHRVAVAAFDVAEALCHGLHQGHAGDEQFRERGHRLPQRARNDHQASQQAGECERPKRPTPQPCPARRQVDGVILVRVGIEQADRLLGQKQRGEVGPSPETARHPEAEVCRIDLAMRLPGLAEQRIAQRAASVAACVDVFTPRQRAPVGARRIQADLQRADDEPRHDRRIGQAHAAVALFARIAREQQQARASQRARAGRSAAPPGDGATLHESLGDRDGAHDEQDRGDARHVRRAAQARIAKHQTARRTPPSRPARAALLAEHEQTKTQHQQVCGERVGEQHGRVRDHPRIGQQQSEQTDMQPASIPDGVGAAQHQEEEERRQHVHAKQQPRHRLQKVGEPRPSVHRAQHAHHRVREQREADRAPASEAQRRAEVRKARRDAVVLAGIAAKSLAHAQRAEVDEPAGTHRHAKGRPEPARLRLHVCCGR